MSTTDTPVEKECAICGAIFETTNPLRKYCDDCSAHSSSRKHEYTRAYRESYSRMYEPKMLTLTCDECGKEFQTIAKCKIMSREDTVQYVFCCPACKKAHRERYERANNFCLNCGKFVENYPEQYCSEACKEEHAIRVAEQNGTLRTCQFCGKKFIRVKASTFCCQECYRKAVQAGWRPAKPAPAAASVKVNEVCANCGKTFERTCTKEQLLNRSEPCFCSDACQAEYTAKQKAERERQQKLAEEQTAIAKRAAEKAKEKDAQERLVPLCATCKTAYADCDRMSSEFRILPKGAAYNSRGILAVCPQYTEGKKKHLAKKSM